MVVLGDLGGVVAHQEVCRFCIEKVKSVSARTPVAVRHGTRPTWESLDALMGMTPTDCVCNCGPTSAPANPLCDKAHGRRT